MFNSPILDVATGLVFVFLLYSLLATSIKESFATLFGLRARMLRKGIISGMLSDTQKNNRWLEVWLGLVSFLKQCFYLVTGVPRDKDKKDKLGNQFYDHPLIMNYGSNRIFPYPSYIPTTDFSTILKEVLKKEFNGRLADIAQFKFTQPGNQTALVNIITGLQNSTDILQINELLEYFAYQYNNAPAGQDIHLPIDRETLSILQMHLKNSLYNTAAFTKKIEDWFDQSMDRVSGWYKRQVQFILFFMGLVLAIAFNADTIAIVDKLSTDKDARDKMIQLAIQGSEKYKDDPGVKKAGAAGRDTLSAADMDSNKMIFATYKAQLDSVKGLVNGDVKNVNNVMGLGWGDYGQQRDSAAMMQAYKAEIDSIKKMFPKDSADNNKILKTLYDKHWVKLKLGYILSSSLNGRRLLGFIILAFAVCLGAPFWFDTLSKIIRLRGSGKKEDSSDDDKPGKNNTPPITVNVNTQPI